ncbi:MAG: hypothetical protein JWN55_778 [Frankiales bacterium]|jgi:hypothetical protein|nr:hypothetical protein [Frankiales bacterium]
MIKKLTLLVGVGAGYVLGTKAGTQRYEQIKRAAQDLMGRPQVQHATETLQHTATDLADKAKGAVTEQVDKVTSKTVDLSEKAPMPGAAPSNTVV